MKRVCLVLVAGLLSAHAARSAEQNSPATRTWFPVPGQDRQQGAPVRSLLSLFGKEQPAAPRARVVPVTPKAVASPAPVELLPVVPVKQEKPVAPPPVKETKPVVPAPRKDTKPVAPAPVKEEKPAAGGPVKEPQPVAPMPMKIEGCASGPAPCGTAPCQQCTSPCGGGAASRIWAWLTFRASTCHPSLCGCLPTCVPYTPPLYTFFLDRCQGGGCRSHDLLTVPAAGCCDR
jgi:hypothetical protein